MGQTIAQPLREEGEQRERVRSRQQTLLRQLRNKFGALPRSGVRAVKAVTSVRQLDHWLDQIITATTLEEMEIDGKR